MICLSYHLNKKVLQFLPWSDVDGVLVASTFPLEKLFVDEEEIDGRELLDVDWDAELIRMSGRYPDVTYKIFRFDQMSSSKALWNVNILTVG